MNRLRKALQRRFGYGWRTLWTLPRGAQVWIGVTLVLIFCATGMTIHWVRTYL